MQQIVDLRNDEAFQELNVGFVSIAFDSPAELAEGAEQYDVGDVPLLTDADHVVSEAYDVMQWAVGTGEPGHTFILVDVEGKVAWTAVEEKYFTSTLVPISENPAQVRASNKNEGTITYKLLYPFISLNPGEEKTYSFFLYIGPKDIDILSSQNALLEKTIDFGWLISSQNRFC